MNDPDTTVGTSDEKSPMVESAPSNTSDSTAGSKPVVDVSKLPRIRRHSYVIDKRRQYRTALLTSSLAAILLIIVNTAFTILRSSQTMLLSAAAPQLESSLSQQDSRVGLVLIVVSIIFVIGVFIITIAETHRTAGAVYAMSQAIDRVSDGDYRTPLRLRPKDNLRDLRAPFNEMLSILRKQAAADAEELDRLAESAANSPALAEQLNAFAAKKRETGGAETTA